MLDIHVMVNWHLSKQSICWSHCGIKFRAHGGWPNCWFWIISQAHVRLTCCKQGWAVWKLVIDANLVFFTAFVLHILRLFKLKTEGQTKSVQNTSLQSYKNSYQNFCLSSPAKFWLRSWRDKRELAKISKISLKLARSQQDLAGILKLEQEMHNPFYN